MGAVHIFMLAACVCAVTSFDYEKSTKSNDKDYIFVSIDHPIQEKPFSVYWNVPTKQCTSKKIPFQNLYEKFGIIQNEHDIFEGEKITVLYDEFNGLFPALLKNYTSGGYEFRNGGVPQEGDLTKHLEALEEALNVKIPDKRYRGIGVIDFEMWKPTFRQNWGSQEPHKNASYEVERKASLQGQSDGNVLDQKQLEARGEQRFEESARVFMQATIARAKELRPHAFWGYYGYPYCYNMISNNMVEDCSVQITQENDNLAWLWEESAILFPSVYSRAILTTSQLTALIKGRVREAARLGKPILPYFWYRYNDIDKYFSEEDLNAALETLYKSNASGFIIWGSSNDVQTPEKCTKLLNYIENVMGPAIAKYTKQNANKTITDTNYYLTDKDKEKDIKESVTMSSTTVSGTTVITDHQITTTEDLVNNETKESAVTEVTVTKAPEKKTSNKVEAHTIPPSESPKNGTESENLLRNITTEVHKIIHNEMLKVKEYVSCGNDEYKHVSRTMDLNDLRIDTLEKENMYLMKVNKVLDHKMSVIEERLKAIEEKVVENVVEVTGNIQINLGHIQVKSHV